MLRVRGCTQASVIYRVVGKLLLALLLLCLYTEVSDIRLQLWRCSWCTRTLKVLRAYV